MTDEHTKGAVSKVTGKLEAALGRLTGNKRQADKLGDAGTADLFTEVSRSADKHLYFLEAHLQEQRPREVRA